MNRQEILRIFIIIVIVVLVLSVIIWVNYQNKRYEKQCMEMVFNGVIWKIEFDDKHYPTIFINDTFYYIGKKEDDIDLIIKVGDSIVKNKGSVKYILFKKDNNNNWQLILNN